MCHGYMIHATVIKNMESVIIFSKYTNERNQSMCFGLLSSIIYHHLQVPHVIHLLSIRVASPVVLWSSPGPVARRSTLFQGPRRDTPARAPPPSSETLRPENRPLAWLAHVPQHTAPQPSIKHLDKPFRPFPKLLGRKPVLDSSSLMHRTLYDLSPAQMPWRKWSISTHRLDSSLLKMPRWPASGVHLSPPDSHRTIPNTAQWCPPLLVFGSKKFISCPHHSFLVSSHLDTSRIISNNRKALPLSTSTIKSTDSSDSRFLLLALLALKDDIHVIGDPHGTS